MKKEELLEMASEEMDTALRLCKSDNLLEAWTLFIQNLDCLMRRRIGDRLEQQGKNRYTGK